MLPGVVAVVRDGSFLGVIAEREEQAIKASLALAESARWTAGPPLPDEAHIYDRLLALPTEDKVVNEKEAALPEGVKFVEATYRKPYMAHAAIGPSCAVAQLSDGKMTVWTHSQGVFPLRGNLAMALKMPAGEHPLHPRRRLGLLRPQCSGRRGARRRAAGAGRGRAGRCACSGCGPTSFCGSRSGPPW